MKITHPRKKKKKKEVEDITISRLSATLDKYKVSDPDAIHLLTAASESFQVSSLDFTINK